MIFFNKTYFDIGLNYQLHTFDSSANPTKLITQFKAITARTRICSIHIGANLWTIMSKCLAFIDIYTFFGIFWINNISGIAKAQVTTSGQIIATMLTTSSGTLKINKEIVKINSYKNIVSESFFKWNKSVFAEKYFTKQLQK